MDQTTAELFEGNVWKSSDELHRTKNTNDEVLEAPDPELFYNSSANAIASPEITEMIALATNVSALFEQTCKKYPARQCDEIRGFLRDAGGDARRLSDLNDTLYLMVTDRGKMDLLPQIFATLQVRADLEAGTLHPNQAKLRLSDLMGVNAEARARLRKRLAEEAAASNSLA
jgi:hypothetical protein